MKTTTILLSVALAFKTIYSKAIDNISSAIIDQLNIPEDYEDVEIVKSDNFIYKFHCSDEKEFCDKIKNDLEFAFDTISNAFEFYQPVIFEAFVEDLTLKYGFANTLAGVSDPNYVSLKTSNDSSSAPYLYPQALAKQLKLDKEPVYKRNDFIMVINNCNSIPEFKNNEIRSILIHEIFHGLGFSSLAFVSKLDDNDVFSIDGGESQINFNEEEKYAIFPYMIPSYSKKLVEMTTEEDYMNQLYISEIPNYAPYSVFDKNLASIESGEKLFEGLEFYYKEANQKCLPEDGSPLLLKDTTDKYFNDCFEKLSPETQELITHIARDYYFESHTIGILTKDGDIVPVQTMDGTYQPSSSVSHITNPLYDKLYSVSRRFDPVSLNELIDFQTGEFKLEAILKYYDDNYILYFSDEDDFTVEEMLELLPNNKKHPLIGDGIVKIMKTLGWTEKGEKRSKDTYYLDESISLAEAEDFEYMFMRRYEVMDHDDHFSTEIDFELETASVIEEEPTFSVIGEEPSDIVVEEEPTVSVIGEEPSDIVVEEEPTVSIIGEEPADIVVEEEPTVSIIGEEPSDIVVEEEPTDSIIGEEPSDIVIEEPTVIEEEPTIKVDEVETALLDDPYESSSSVTDVEEEPTQLFP